MAQQIQFCKSADGTRIAYSIVGSGSPLVWVRAFGHLQFDYEGPIWKPWLSWLTGRHRVVRYDWRGCGLSDREEVRFSSKQHLEDLQAVVAAAKLERFTLLAMSSESGVAIAYAVQHAAHVARLVLYGPHLRGRLLRSTTPEQLEEVETRLRVLRLGWPNDTPAYGQFFASLHIPGGSREQIDSFNSLLQKSTSLEDASKLLRCFWEEDLRDLAPQVQCPTLVVHARGSTLIPFDEGRALAALIPDARLLPLESRNHIILPSEPAWQELVAALESFCGSSSGTGKHQQLLDELTARERDVLELVAQGLPNRDIAGKLRITDKTVRNHLSAIFCKLGIARRAEAIVLARDAGFGQRIP